jgi:hypothetical protein
MSLSNINNGLVFAASPTLPEYPDNAAGTTYLQDAWTHVNWTLVSATESISGGVNTITPTATVNGRLDVTIAIPANSTIKVKIRRPTASANNIRLAVFDGTTTTNLYIAPVGTEWAIINMICPASAQTIFRIYADNTAGTAPLAIDWIYIGDGTYSSRLLDVSGSGNHGTVFGATPTADGGLSFDKINDYFVTPVFVMPDVYTFNSIITNCLQDATAIQLLHGYGVSGSARLTLWRVAGSDSLNIAWFSSSGQNTTVANVFSNTPNAVVNFAFTINYATGAYTVWKNGVSFATGTLTGIVKPSATNLFIGSQFTTPANQFFGGILRNTRIYNRALTAAEIEALATNPDAYNLDRVVRSITPVPTSVMTRDINGDTQVRRLESTIATGTAPLTVASTTLVTNLNADRVDSLEGSDFVRGTGTVSQTITGVKTFSSIPVLPASDPTTVNQATRKAYIDGKLPGKITISVGAPTGGTDGDIWITI